MEKGLEEGQPEQRPGEGCCLGSHEGSAGPDWGSGRTGRKGVESRDT